MAHVVVTMRNAGRDLAQPLAPGLQTHGAEPCCQLQALSTE
jgi:hypothetical protein